MSPDTRPSIPSKATTRRPAVNALALVGGIILAAAGGGAAALALDDSAETTTVVTGSASNVSSSDDEALSVNAIYRRASNGVVEIKATSATATAPGPFGTPGDGRRESEGSGLVLNEDGDIVTNEHVVADADAIEVTFADGTTAEAEVLGEDASSDVAVIHVDVPASKLEPLTFGDSSQVEVGDGVVAIGSPYGYEGTVTTGIVSALDRGITSPSGYTISGTLQTDAAINPGNSGGPLLDSAGRVIGINAQIESSSEGNSGVGFAIPSNTVKEVAEAVVAGEQVEHAYLGVSVTDDSDGARIGAVRDGSPAEGAGLEPGDLVVAIDGEPVSAADGLTAAIDAMSPGDEISLTIERDGERLTLDVTLGTRPE